MAILNVPKLGQILNKYLANRTTLLTLPFRLMCMILATEIRSDVCRSLIFSSESRVFCSVIHQEPCFVTYNFSSVAEFENHVPKGSHLEFQ